MFPTAPFSGLMWLQMFWGMNQTLPELIQVTAPWLLVPLVQPPPAPPVRLPSVHLPSGQDQDPNSQPSTVAPGNRDGFQLCVTSLFLSNEQMASKLRACVRV